MNKKFICTLLTALIALGMLLTGCNSSENVDTVKSGFDTSKIDDYVIIYPHAEETEYKILAKEISSYIDSALGERVRFYSDEREKGDYEILLGKTNRKLSSENYKTNPDLFTHKLVVKGNSMQIVSGGAYSAKHCFDTFKAEVFRRSSKLLAEGTYYEQNLYTKPADRPVESQVRIMSTNLLSEQWGLDENKLTTNYRAEIYATMLLGYAPDVVGVQECDKTWQELLTKYLTILKDNYNLNYQFLLNDNSGTINYSCLLYRADKFAPVNYYGLQRFNWWQEIEGENPSFDMRNISYAQFNPINLSGLAQSFVVANTHWSYRTEHEDAYGTNVLRTQCKEETNEFLNELKKNLNCPIFVTGDFNTSLSYFEGASSWMSASEFTLLSSQASENGCLQKEVPQSGFYDHVFGNGNYTVVGYTHFNTGNQIGYVSDHSFIVADIVIN